MPSNWTASQRQDAALTVWHRLGEVLADNHQTQDIQALKLALLQITPSFGPSCCMKTLQELAGVIFDFMLISQEVGLSKWEHGEVGFNELSFEHDLCQRNKGKLKAIHDALGRAIQNDFMQCFHQLAFDSKGEFKDAPATTHNKWDHLWDLIVEMRAGEKSVGTDSQIAEKHNQLCARAITEGKCERVEATMIRQLRFERKNRGRHKTKRKQRD